MQNSEQHKMVMKCYTCRCLDTEKFKQNNTEIYEKGMQEPNLDKALGAHRPPWLR